MNDEFDPMNSTSKTSSEPGAADTAAEAPVSDAQTGSDSAQESPTAQPVTPAETDLQAAAEPQTDIPDPTPAAEAQQAAPTDAYPNPFAPQPTPAAQMPYGAAQAPCGAPAQPTAQAPYGAPAQPYVQPQANPYGQPGYTQQPYYRPAAYGTQQPYGSPNGYGAQPPVNPYGQSGYGGQPPVSPYAPPAGYTPYPGAQPAASNGGAQTPPPPPYGYHPAYGNTNPPRAPKASGKAGKIAMWIVAGLIEAVIVGFAIYGVYALCTRDTSGTLTDRPSISDGLPTPGGNGNQNPGNGSASSGSSSQVENNSKVQMGITCFELPDEYVQQYGIEKGLVVKDFASDSPALNTELAIADVITAANGTRVTTFEELFAVLEKMNAGDSITLTCYRMMQSGDTAKASDPFEVTFQVQEKHDVVSSYPAA